MPSAVVDESHRRTDKQFPAPGLVQDAALQPGPQDVQLRLAHGSFQPQQQPVVEVSRIVDAIFVEDEGVG